ncbi:Keratinocyte-associated protein 2 [Trinorchestia longiramus]|nr:Keratinocyte-associated protein 2 [Trinorchestia longiramus]
MGLTGRSSSGLAAVCCTMLFAGLQMFKTQLGSSRLLTLVAGYVSSWIFVFLLISVNSLEQVMFGPGFQSKLPEVVLCIIIACGSAATVHRVSSTVCLLCSIVALYFISRISEEHQSHSSPAGLYAKKKK